VTSLSTFGALRDESIESITDWIRAAIAAELTSNDRYHVLSLTARGRDYMNERLDDAGIRRPSIARWRGVCFIEDHPSQCNRTDSVFVLVSTIL